MFEALFEAPLAGADFIFRLALAGFIWARWAGLIDGR